MKSLRNIKILLIILTLNTFVIQAQNDNDLKCNISVVAKTEKNIDNITKKQVLTFLKTFGTECKNNVEFQEYSNEILFKILELKTDLFCQVVNEEMNKIEINQIIQEIGKPINDLHNNEIIKNKISKSKLEENIKVKIINALNLTK